MEHFVTVFSSSKTQATAFSVSNVALTEMCIDVPPSSYWTSNGIRTELNDKRRHNGLVAHETETTTLYKVLITRGHKHRFFPRS